MRHRPFRAAARASRAPATPRNLEAHYEQVAQQMQPSEEFEFDETELLDNPKAYKKGKGKYELTPRSVQAKLEREWQMESLAHDDLGGYESELLGAPPVMKYRQVKNPGGRRGSYSPEDARLEAHYAEIAEQFRKRAEGE